MKLKLTLFVLILSFLKISGQIIFTENFDNFNSLVANGWTIQNSSQPLGTTTWGTSTLFPPYNGGAGSFASANYQSAQTWGTISNWLISPVISLKNGDVISFYTRTKQPDAFPLSDRLEVRISTNGSVSTLPNSNSESVGDFTALVTVINPTEAVYGYPSTWTNFSPTIFNLSQPTNCRIAFRYYVTGAGTYGGEIIGIDALSITSSPLSNEDFTLRKLKIVPNPTSNFLMIENLDLNMGIEVYNYLGKKLNVPKINDNSFDVSSLSKGVYIVKIIEDSGATETLKFIKN